MAHTSLEALEVDCDVQPLDIRWAICTHRWYNAVLLRSPDDLLRQQCVETKSSDTMYQSFVFRSRRAPVLRTLDQQLLQSDSTLNSADARAEITRAAGLEWRRRWHDDRHMRDVDHGAHLFALKPLPGNTSHQWTVDRRLSSMRCRLRHGHCDLNEYRRQIGLADSESCPHCDHTETIEHFVLECDQYRAARDALFASIRPGLPRTLPVVLATSELLKPTDRREAVQALDRYILSTNRFALP